MDKAGPSKTIDQFFSRVQVDDDKSPSHEASSVSLETELETQSSAGIHSTSASES